MSLLDDIRAYVTEAEDPVAALNELRKALHDVSPFKTEPVDCVLWVSKDDVVANDYNPNAVAPPEMELLERSILHDGFTQPIVAWAREDGIHEVVDGFHRNRVGRESEAVSARIGDYLPLAVISEDREGRGDRIASTIRHNRARGKHRIDSMAEIVLELKRRNWSPKKIGKELGMDPDEVLRLAQITGLAEMFRDNAFSMAWEPDGDDVEPDLPEMTDPEPAEEKEKRPEMGPSPRSGYACYS